MEKAHPYVNLLLKGQLRMKIAAFQFAASSVISDNYLAMQRAITEAHQQDVRLLVFQECALSGYPPVETEKIEDIDFLQMDSCITEIKRQAKQYDMYIALGLVRKSNLQYYNSILLANPAGEIAGIYDKRALWGWDSDNFTPGEATGIFQIDEIPVGFRICYEVRFPEYFRELFAAKVPLCFASFCDVSKQKDDERYEIIKAHLITRATENVMTVVSVNSLSSCQTAPTAVFSPDGHLIAQALSDTECLLVYDYQTPENTFSGEGRKKISKMLQGKNIEDAGK